MRAPTTSTASPPEPATTDLADGRHPAELRNIETAQRRATVDVVQWFFGAAATKAAAEDGRESPPPNDYYVRNQNPRLRTLTVARDVKVVITGLKEGEASIREEETTFEKLATLRYQNSLFWLTVKSGTVVRIEEQYLP